MILFSPNALSHHRCFCGRGNGGSGESGPDWASGSRLSALIPLTWEQVPSLRSSERVQWEGLPRGPGPRVSGRLCLRTCPVEASTDSTRLGQSGHVPRGGHCHPCTNPLLWPSLPLHCHRFSGRTRHQPCHTAPWSTARRSSLWVSVAASPGFVSMSAPLLAAGCAYCGSRVLAGSARRRCPLPPSRDVCLPAGGRVWGLRRPRLVEAFQNVLCVSPLADTRVSLE